jgi:DNA-binding winged helix-turn-helix (wHTH) protein/TolB-like protein/tetratricopeptide (TPR) repeat protein
MSQLDSKIYAFGDFRLDPAEGALYRQNRLIALTPKAFDTLLVLVRHAGHVVSKEELMQQVWPDTFVEDGNLNVHIFALRKVLADNDGDQTYIETIPRRGYRFVVPVHAVDSSDTLLIHTHRRARIITEELIETPELPSTQEPVLPHAPLDIPLLPAPRLKVRSTLLRVASLGLAVALGAAATWFYFNSRTLHGVTSIVVLPFVNATADPALDYLSEGLTESLTSSVSELPGLRVVSRNTADRYKGRQAEAASIGNELNVSAVMVGKMAPHKDGFSVHLELLDAKDGTRLWGATFERRLAGLPTLDDEVAYEISSRLGLNQGAKRFLAKPVRHGTENPEAFQLYLKGRHHCRQLSSEGLSKCAAYLQQAIEKDPHYALAYAGLADYYASLPYVNNVPPHEAFPRAKEHALKALQMDGDLAEAHASLGSILEDYDWDLASAEKEYVRAITLNPNYSTAYEWYGHYLSRLGRHEEAFNRLQQGLTVDPLSVNLNVILATALFFSREYEPAIQQANRTLELEPQFAYGHFLLGLVYRQQRKYELSIAEFTKTGPAFDDDAYVLGYLGKIYADSGNKSAAVKNLARLRQLSSRGYSSPLASALVYFGLHDPKRAYEHLEKAYRAHDPYLLYLKVDPVFDSVRSDPEFQEMMRRVGI